MLRAAAPTQRGDADGRIPGCARSRIGHEGIVYGIFLAANAFPEVERDISGMMAQDTMKDGMTTASAALLLALLSLFAGRQGAHAQAPPLPFAAVGGMARVEARFIDRATAQEAGWGATGQILIPPQPADPALQRWQQARAVATSLARQSVSLAPGGTGLIRVGREIPFAGWFLRHGTSCGWLEQGTEWREVESALEIEIGTPAADGSVRIGVTPEFSYLSGRTRRTVSFPGERAEMLLVPGVESRFVPGARLEAFYGRLLAGYDPLRRVWPVELLLRVDVEEAPGP